MQKKGATETHKWASADCSSLKVKIHHQKSHEQVSMAFLDEEGYGNWSNASPLHLGASWNEDPLVEVPLIDLLAFLGEEDSGNPSNTPYTLYLHSECLSG